MREERLKADQTIELPKHGNEKKSRFRLVKVAEQIALRDVDKGGATRACPTQGPKCTVGRC